jgi:hypothetical protein
MFLTSYKREPKLASGSETKESIQVASRRKTASLTNFRIQELEGMVSNGRLRRHLGDPFEQLAEYARSMGTVFLHDSEKSSWAGRTPKESIQVATKGRDRL